MNDRQLKAGDRVCWGKRSPTHTMLNKGKVISHDGDIVKLKFKDKIISIPRARVRMESILRN
jgi:hypothetical protein